MHLFNNVLAEQEEKQRRKQRWENTQNITLPYAVRHTVNSGVCHLSIMYKEAVFIQNKGNES